MTSTASLTIAAHRVSRDASKCAPSPVRMKATGSRTSTVLRGLAMLAGSLVLIVSLVDPPHGSGTIELQTAVFDKEMRHG